MFTAALFIIFYHSLQSNTVRNIELTLCLCVLNSHITGFLLDLYNNRHKRPKVIMRKQELNKQFDFIKSLIDSNDVMKYVSKSSFKFPETLIISVVTFNHVCNQYTNPLILPQINSCDFMLEGSYKGIKIMKLLSCLAHILIIN